MNACDAIADYRREVGGRIEERAALVPRLIKRGQTSKARDVAVECNTYRASLHLLDDCLAGKHASPERAERDAIEQTVNPDPRD